MFEFKLPYGLKENELVTIDEVSNGLSCNCVCPACGKRLIAKKGDVKAHHFAHFQTDDCSAGLETALHKICKEIIFNSPTFATPVLYYPNTIHKIFDEREIEIDDVQLEKRLGGIIPDIVIKCKTKFLFVEIVVNNPVSLAKLQKIRAENLAVIVIDAKHLLQYIYRKRDFKITDPGLQHEIIYGTDFKRWLHNPVIEKKRELLKMKYAVKKEVHSFDTDSGKYFFVYNCPLEKKLWKSGKYKGSPYASFDYDCANCAYCVTIVHDYVPHKWLENFGHEIPNSVYCVGHKKDRFQQLLNQLQ